MDKWEGIEKEIKMFSPNTIFGDYSATSKNESDITKQIVYLHMKDILKLLTKENLKTIPIKKIAWKTKYFSDDKKGKNCICCGGKRFEKCDIKFPSVVIDGMKNPHNLRYRVIDGKHRMEKRVHKGMKKSLCYVLQWEKIKKYLKIKRIDDNGEQTYQKINLRNSNKKIYMFDVDGTLTPSRQKMTEEFAKFFDEWSSKNTYYLVTGSDLKKTKEQLPIAYIDRAEAIFTCCGNEMWEDGKQIYRKKFKPPKELIKYLEEQLETSEYPVRAGNHIEDRGTLLNFSIVGRDCSLEERLKYHEYDIENKERKIISKYIRKHWKELEAVIGGQISIDIYPMGNNKSQTLKHIYKKHISSKIIFIGDGIENNGNDYPLAQLMGNVDGCYSYHTKGWEQTKQILESLND